MIRRFFQWRAKRRLARTRYRFDRRSYPGRFQAGFLSHLQQGSFWEMNKNPRLRRRGRRQTVLLLLVIIGTILLIWGIITSIEGIKLFALQTSSIN